MRRGFLYAVVVVATLGGRPEQADAYYDDVHYHFTYYLAREAGFTPEQAYRIASANLSVDYAVRNEPVQPFWSKVDLITPQVIDLELQRWTGTVHTRRFRFHAFRHEKWGGTREYRNWDGSRSSRFGTYYTLHPPVGRTGDWRAAEKRLLQQRVKLWVQGLEMGNPGVFMHFVMDVAPHSGYATGAGHWLYAASPNSTLHAEQGLPQGSTTDYLSYQNERATEPRHAFRSNRVLAEKTIARFRSFMRVASPHQWKQMQGAPADMQRIDAVASRLRKANPYPESIPVPYLWELSKLFLGQNPADPSVELFLRKHLDGPSYRAAHKVVVEGLRKAGMVEVQGEGYEFTQTGPLKYRQPLRDTVYEYERKTVRRVGLPHVFEPIKDEKRRKVIEPAVDERITFAFDDEGDPLPKSIPAVWDINSFNSSSSNFLIDSVAELTNAHRARPLLSLVGTLKVEFDVEETLKEWPEPVEVSVLAVPTRASDKEFELARMTSKAPAEALEFEKMPVGDLRIKVFMGKDVLADRTVRLYLSEQKEIVSPKVPTGYVYQLAEASFQESPAYKKSAVSLTKITPGRRVTISKKHSAARDRVQLTTSMKFDAPSTLSFAELTSYVRKYRNVRGQQVAERRIAPSILRAGVRFGVSAECETNRAARFEVRVGTALPVPAMLSDLGGSSAFRSVTQIDKAGVGRKENYVRKAVQSQFLKAWLPKPKAQTYGPGLTEFAYQSQRSKLAPELLRSQKSAAELKIPAGSGVFDVYTPDTANAKAQPDTIEVSLYCTGKADSAYTSSTLRLYYKRIETAK